MGNISCNSFNVEQVFTEKFEEINGLYNLSLRKIKNAKATGTMSAEGLQAKKTMDFRALVNKTRKKITDTIKQVSKENGYKDNESAQSILSALVNSQLNRLDPGGMWTVDTISNIISGNTKLNKRVESITLEALDPAKTRRDLTLDFYSKAYGSLTDLRDAAKQKIAMDIVKATCVDHEKRRLILTNDAMNSAIRDLKNELWYDIVNYLQSMKFADATNEQLQNLPADSMMYDGSGKYLGTFEEYEQLVDNFLKKVDENNLKSTPLLQKAYASWLALKNFDAVLVAKKGHTIDVVDGYFGDGKFDKTYKMSSKGDSNPISWSNQENRTIDQDVSSEVKDLICSLTRYTENGVPLPGQYVSFEDFVHVVLGIKSLANIDEDVDLTRFYQNNSSSISEIAGNTILEYKTLKNLVSNIRTENIRDITTTIFELLTNPKFMKSADLHLARSYVFGGQQGVQKVAIFTPRMRGTLHALNEGLFSVTNETSLRKLNEQQIDPNDASRGNFTQIRDLTHFVLQAIDTISSNDTVQSFVTDSNTVELRELKDSSAKQYQYNVENNLEARYSINNINNPLHKTEKTILDSYSVNEDNLEVTFKFKIPTKEGNPVTLEFKYSPSDKSVSCIDDGMKMKDQDAGVFTEPYTQQIIEFTYGIKFDPEVSSADISNFSSIQQCVSVLAMAAYNEHLKEAQTVNQFKMEFTSKVSSDSIPTLSSNKIAAKLIQSRYYVAYERIASYIAALRHQIGGLTVKSNDGSQQSVATAARLCSQLQQQIHTQCKKPGAAANDLYIVREDGFLGQTYNVKELVQGEATPATQFSVGTHAQLLIESYFLGGLVSPSENNLSSPIGDGRIVLITSSNSDKSYIPLTEFNLNKEYIVEDASGNKVKKPLYQLTSKQLDEAIQNELGTMYKKVAKSVIDEWNRVLELPISTEPEQQIPLKEVIGDTINGVTQPFQVTMLSQINEISKRLTDKGYIASDLIRSMVRNYNYTHTHKLIELIDQTHWRQTKGGTFQANETLITLAARYGNELHKPGLTGRDVQLQAHWHRKQAELMRDIIESGAVFSPARSTTDYIQAYKKIGGDAFEAEMKKWVDSYGNCIIGKVTLVDKNGQAKDFNLQSSHDFKILNEYIDENADSFGELKLVKPGVPLVNDIQRLSDAQDLFPDRVKVSINPVLERYNKIDFFCTEQYMAVSVGGHFNHPAKKSKKNNYVFDDSTHTRWHEEAEEKVAQNKRNVQNTSTVKQFTPGSLLGAPHTLNIMAVNNESSTCYNVLGALDDGVLTDDGAMWVNPFLTYLENNSLGGDRAGITKKHFLHIYHFLTATGKIIKTCGFGLSNMQMAASPKMRLLMKKMTDRPWRSHQIDEYDADVILTDWNITTDHAGHDIFNVRNSKNPLRFRADNGKYYTITKIEYQGNNSYKIYGQEFSVIRNSESIEGILKSDTESVEDMLLNDICYSDMLNTDGNVVIDTNYKLWKAFGGVNSVELSGNKIIQSESSIEQVVYIMNHKGEVLDASKPITSTVNYYQPMKYSDGHYWVTEGALKQGLSNLNSSSILYDNTVADIFQIEAKHAGIQLDKEHHASNEELSLPTQVVNACMHLGYSTEQAMEVFNALASIADSHVKPLLTPFRKLLALQSGKPDLETATKEEIGAWDEKNKQAMSELKLALFTQIFESVSNQSQDDNNLLTLIGEDAVQKIRDGQKLTNANIDKIPIDNSAILNVAFKELQVFLTKAIKIHTAGQLDVLNPSVGWRKIYFGKTYQQIEHNDLDMPAEEYLRNLQAKLDENPINFRHQTADGNLIGFIQGGDLYMGRTYKLTHTVENVVNGIPTTEKVSEYYTLDSPIARRQLQNRVKELVGSDAVLTECQWDPEHGIRGRDLAPQDILWKDAAGRQYSIWDLDSINRTFENLTDSERKAAKDLVKTELRLLGKNPDYEFSVCGGIKVKCTGKTTTRNYGAILPKRYIEQFGLQVGTSLSEVLKDGNDPSYFIDQSKQNLNTKDGIADEQFTVELKRLNGNHVYLLDKTRASEVTNARPLTIAETREDGKRYRIDPNSGKIIQQLKDNDTVLITDGGVEIIVTDDLNYYIEKEKFSLIRISSNLQQNDQIQLAESIYTQEVEEQDKSGNTVVKKVTKPRFAKYAELVQTVGSNFAAYNLELRDIKKNLSNETSQVSNTYSGKHLLNRIQQEANETYTSFKQTLNIIASRTPSQSMQSFMAMTIEGFEQSDVNNAYVSNMQIYLQGSDFDVDAVSIVQFDVDRNGKFIKWSPYIDLSSQEAFNRTSKIPFPTGKEVRRSETAETDLEELTTKLIDCINSEISPSGEIADILTDPLIDLIEYTKNHPIPEMKVFANDVNLLKKLREKELNNKAKIENLAVFESYINEYVIKKINKHNTWLYEQNQHYFESAASNFVTDRIFKIISDPANVPQATISVDAMTGGPKKIASRSLQESLVANASPGSFMNRIQSTCNALVGKDAVGICAVGMKDFFGLTAYVNSALANGKKSVYFAKTLRLPNADGVLEDKTFNLLANANGGKNFVNNLQNALNELSERLDCALDLSALMSLATDNAKDLALDKLNATPETLGLYIYAMSIGMSFEEIAGIMMSNTGNILKRTLSLNALSGKKRCTSVNSALNYFILGPRELTDSYSGQISVDHINRPALTQQLDDYITTAVINKLSNKEGTKEEKTQLNNLKVLLSNAPVHERIRILAKIYDRNAWNKFLDGFISQYKTLTTDGYKASKFALSRLGFLINDLNLYYDQLQIIADEPHILNNIDTLAGGAAEMKILGSIYGLNQGLKTTIDESLNQIEKIETCISTMATFKNNQKDRLFFSRHILPGVFKNGFDSLTFNTIEDVKNARAETLKTYSEKEYTTPIDLVRLCYDSQYRSGQSEIYQRVRDTFNLIEAITYVPHFSKYLGVLALGHGVMDLCSNKYKCVHQLAQQLNQDYGKTAEAKTRVRKGVMNFYQDFMRNRFLTQRLDYPLKVQLPNELLRAFGVDAVRSVTGAKESTVPIWLGTTTGNALFKAFVETQVIPALKKKYTGNKFMSDLQLAEFDKGPSKNLYSAYTVPTTTMPKTSDELAQLNAYKNSYRYVESESIKVGEGKTMSFGDIMFVYSLLAYGGKRSQRSLMPIVETTSQLTTGIESWWNQFLSNVDPKDFQLGTHFSTEDVEPYIIPVTTFQQAAANNQPVAYVRDLETKQVHKYKKSDTGNEYYEEGDDYSQWQEMDYSDEYSDEYSSYEVDTYGYNRTDNKNIQKLTAPYYVEATIPESLDIFRDMMFSANKFAQLSTENQKEFNESLQQHIEREDKDGITKYKLSKEWHDKLNEMLDQAINCK